MWSTTDTTRALVQARNDGVKLTAVKDGGAAAEGAADGTTASVLEALGAVVPTGVLSIYTGVVLVLRQTALTEGSASRDQLKEVLQTDGNTAAQVADALKKLPQETDTFIGLRILLLVVAALTVIVMAISATRAGNQQARKRRKLPFAEPFAAIVAFLGWALASPGTPLAAFHPSGTVTALSIVIGAIAGLFLLATGDLSLAKPAKRAEG